MSVHATTSPLRDKILSLPRTISNHAEVRSTLGPLADIWRRVPAVSRTHPLLLVEIALAYAPCMVAFGPHIYSNMDARQCAIAVFDIFQRDGNVSIHRIGCANFVFIQHLDAILHLVEQIISRHFHFPISSMTVSPCPLYLADST